MSISMAKLSPKAGSRNACAMVGVNIPTIAVSCQRMNTVPINRVAA
jgi:hypothetical protein